MSKRLLGSGITLTVGAYLMYASTAVGAEIVVLSDDFNSYVDHSAVRAAWNGNNITINTQYTPDIRFSSASWSLVGTPQPITLPSTAMFANEVVYRPLSQTVVEDFSVTIDVVSTVYQRTQRIGMMDATGLNGYAVAWNTQNVNQYSGKGTVGVYKYENAAISGNGTLIGSITASGHWATGVEYAVDNNAEEATYVGPTDPIMATIRFTWSKDEELDSAPGVKGVFRVYVNDELKVEVADSTFSSFDRLYLRGHANGVFDNVQVTTVPEPAAGAAALSGLLLARRRIAR